MGKDFVQHVMKVGLDNSRKGLERDERHNLHFLLYPSINLVAHTSNLLGIPLGGEGSRCNHPDEDVKRAIGFSGQPDRTWFYQTVGFLARDHIIEVEQAIPLIRTVLDHHLKDDQFADILESRWNGFYRGHWNKIFKDLNSGMSNIRCDNIDCSWNVLVDRMEKSTDSKMTTDFYLVGTEAASGVSTMIPPNISIGPVQKDSRLGFTYEGLHLLIALAHDKYKPAYDFADSHEWNNARGLPYRSWRDKIEQAVVITLDSLITRRQEYLDGCLVGDLKGPIHDELVAWYNDGRKEPLHQYLMTILKKHEKQIFSE
jgi:hypothetical protein